MSSLIASWSSKSRPADCVPHAAGNRGPGSGYASYAQGQRNPLVLGLAFTGASRLQPFPSAPHLLGEKDAAEFLEPVGWILGDLEDCITLRNGERHELSSVGERGLELVSHLVAASAIESIGQFNDQVISHRNARQRDRHLAELHSTEEPGEAVRWRFVKQQGSRADSLGGSTVLPAVKVGQLGNGDGWQVDPCNAHGRLLPHRLLPKPSPL